MRQPGKGWLLLTVLALLGSTAMAGQVTIRHADFEHDAEGDGWEVAVTLQHADTGWDHYADGWQVVDEAGHVLGHRTLYHPHVNEQPFTRSYHLNIPAGVTQVYVEAHDTVHGWSPQRLAVDLGRDAGPGYNVSR
jgi:hypothetical protein